MDEQAANRDDVMTARMPTGLIGGLIIFWGIASSNLMVSFSMALFIELSRLSQYRWNLASKHFQNIADVTTVLFAVVAIYQFVQHQFHGIYGILALLPLCLFPLIFAQRVATQQSFPMSALFLSLRRQINDGNADERWISTEFLYGLGCILAASVNDFHGDAYIYCAIIGTCALLFFTRTSPLPIRRWGVSVGIVVVLSLLFLTGIEAGYRYAENAMGYWFRQFTWSYTNPNKTSTAIGQLGRLKLSDRIVLRVKAPLSTPLPIYLHEASYDTFKLGSWHTSVPQLQAIDPLPSLTTWQLQQADVQTVRELEITTRHVQDVTVQPLPLGSVQIKGSEIIEVQKNRLGSVTLEAIPGQLRYRISYNAESLDTNADELRGTPLETDLSVTPDYHDAIDRIVNELGLDKVSPARAVSLLSEYFSEHYRYSLVGKGDYPGKKPLVSFLTGNKSGHCEYFATATTLILRRAGIPARYSVGYLVDEYSALESAFVARARHAHAWSSVYVDGNWQLVDTTPGNWLALEEERVSTWQVLNDLFAWVSMRFNRLQRVDRSDFNRRIIWLVPLLSVFLLWRLRKRATRHVQPDKPNQQKRPADRPQDLQKLLNQLYLSGYTISPGVTLATSLRTHIAPRVDLPSIERLIKLYYVKRFSRRELNHEEQQELDSGIERHLEALRARQSR